MSESPETAGGLLRSSEAARLILNQWVEGMAQVLETMTEQRPQTEWRVESGSIEVNLGGDALLWFEQRCRDQPELAVWIAAPRELWEHAGALTLKAAGLETVADVEARNTWFEILGQSLGVLARAVGALAGREIAWDPALERSPEVQPAEWAFVSMRFSESNPRSLALVLAPPLIAALSPRPEEPVNATVHAPAKAEPRYDPAPSRTLELLLDVDLPVSISFGRTQLALKDVLKLTTGSIVELNCGVGDQVDVLVNHCLLARGEVVVVDGNYGVRIQEIASRRARLRSLE